MDDPFLLKVFDDIAQMTFIAKEIRKQSKTFKNAVLIDDDVRSKAIEAIEELHNVTKDLLPLLFIRGKNGMKERELVKVRRSNAVLLELASSNAAALSEIEKEYYKDNTESGVSGNAFRTVQYRLDVIREAWSTSKRQRN